MTVATAEPRSSSPWRGSFGAARRDPSFFRTKLHDFGFRGVEQRESADIGGAPHFFHFFGTDNLAASSCARIVPDGKCHG